jgi:hypothetical protein
MKKLLLILLCVPLLFISCNKDDDTPGDNNNNGTSTFLENQDGTVWYKVVSNVSDNIGWDTIGFYNSTYFYISKGNNECSQFKNGQNINNDHNVSVSTVIHNSNSILFTVLEEGNPYEYELEFIYDGPNSIKLNFINMEFYFTRSSTETNLSCN